MCQFWIISISVSLRIDPWWLTVPTVPQGVTLNDGQHSAESVEDHELARHRSSRQAPPPDAVLALSQFPS